MTDAVIHGFRLIGGTRDWIPLLVVRIRLFVLFTALWENLTCPFYGPLSHSYTWNRRSFPAVLD